MSTIGDRIRSAIQTTVNTLGDIKRLALGDPTGSYIQLFDIDDARQPGLAWQDDDSSLNIIVRSIGDVFDDTATVYGIVDTNATTVDPTMAKSKGIGTPSKNEVGNTVSVQFTDAFEDALYVIYATVDSGTAPTVASQSSTGFTLNVPLVNGKRVSVACIGTFPS